MSTITISRPPSSGLEPPVAATTPSPTPRDPHWARPCLFVLLAGTALLYLWDLGSSGWANSFYSAAAQAGSRSWSAFFFGSFDAANAITVDKPPVALWVMSLSVRLFGLNAWSILVPEALAGVASVGVLYATVRRWFGASAGLLAGLVLALTPAAALMFRFNNPDAVLTLLLTLSAYCMVRALERASTKWLIGAATLIGFAFLTKMLQAFLVVPGFILVYLIAAPTPPRRRIGQLALAAVALLVAAFWWVVAVMAIPATSRPYIGGSQTNSLWDLIFGYNGFGRLTGNETGSVGGGGGPVNMWGPTGWTRLFNTEFGGQIAWLLPAALILLAGGVAITWRARRTDRARAGLLLWGTWLLVTGIAFSLGQGIIHPYYSVALAPAIGALVGIGVTMLWRTRDEMTSRIFLAAAMAATSWWSYTLLQRTPDWNPWLGPVVLLGGLGVAVALLPRSWLEGRTGALVGAAAIVLGLLGATAYTLETARTPHEGAIPSAGPAVLTRFGLGRGGPFGGGTAGRPPGRTGQFPVGPRALPATGTAPAGGAAPGGAAGGLLDASEPSSELVALLEADADQYTWVAATVGSNSAAGYQLATDQAVMSIGGFNGTDPSPSLAEFQADVDAGKIHYFIAGGFGGRGGRGGPGGNARSTSSEITTWVESNFTATTVGDITVYDLTS